jgi:hypothetical protein
MTAQQNGTLSQGTQLRVMRAAQCLYSHFLRHNNEYIQGEMYAKGSQTDLFFMATWKCRKFDGFVMFFTQKFKLNKMFRKKLG